MDWLALLIAVLALVIAVVAFLRTGGSADLRAKTEEAMSAMGTRTGEARAKAANAVSRLEQSIRGKPSDSGTSS